jgi:hypothetical protein
MLPPPDDGRKRPLLVRYVLGNVHSRTTARRLTLVMLAFVGVAAALQDPVLIAVAVFGVIAYVLSIRWMDRHEAWGPPPDPPA